MKYEAENRICQNCKKDFTIESEDFNFYEKIKVPPPTFCPECRLIRRFLWRNERVLYRRTCDLCKRSIIAMYNETAPFPVYCRGCWLSDGWDPLSYGRDYDFSRSFFEQYRELSNVVPRLALWQRNVINSEYSNMVGESKNVYLSVSVVKNCENVFYSKSVDQSKDIVDSLNIITGSENLYENVEGQSNYNSQYLLLSKNCIDSYYLVDCVNCTNCFLSYNLRNKEFCIRNKQYTREEYFKEIEKFNLGSRSARNLLLKEYEEIQKKAIYRFALLTRCVDVTGNYLLNVKNSKNCFQVYNVENSKYCYRGFDFKDSMDFDYGAASELLYEYSTGAHQHSNVKFTYSAMNSVQNAEYTDICMSSANLFGCISVKSADYIIFNKKYYKTEFEKLRNKIVEHMDTMPYVDKKGRVYKYGEFFPFDFSPLGYNESLAQEFFPLTENEAYNKHYPWYKSEKKTFNITLSGETLPDHINDVAEDIFDEAIGCVHKGDCSHQCNIAFRFTDYELKFYKKHNIPLPVKCPNCRYFERFPQVLPPKLWHRQCMCIIDKHGHSSLCTNEFETSYAPERPEKVYCESCYNKEVY